MHNTARWCIITPKRFFVQFTVFGHRNDYGDDKLWAGAIWRTQAWNEESVVAYCETHSCHRGNQHPADKDADWLID